MKKSVAFTIIAFFVFVEMLIVDFLAIDFLIVYRALLAMLAGSTLVCYTYEET